MARSAAPHLSLIISHEALFRRNGALLALVRAAREQGAETSALAYMRRMSDDLRSVHVQWLFRESRRFAEAFWIGPKGRGRKPPCGAGSPKPNVLPASRHVPEAMQRSWQRHLSGASA